MPRPRTTTAMLDLNGALQHDAKRYATRKNEPTPSAGVGAAPKHLTTAQKKLWKELVSLAIPDVLANTDRWVLELTVKLYERVRSDKFTVADASALRQCLAQLGMTPADRSRVTAMKSETKQRDEWSDLIQ